MSDTQRTSLDRVDELTDDVIAFISEGTRAGKCSGSYIGIGRQTVPGELVVRLRPIKVLKAFELAE